MHSTQHHGLQQATFSRYLRQTRYGLSSQSHTSMLFQGWQDESFILLKYPK